MAVADGATAADVAAAIGPRLAKAALAARVGDKVVDLATPLTEGDQVSIITATSPEGLDVIRHSAAHVLAEAATRLYPGHQGGHRPGHQGRLLLRLRLPAAGGGGRPAQAGRPRWRSSSPPARPFERREVTQGRGRGPVRRTSPTSSNSSAICPRTPSSAPTGWAASSTCAAGPHVPDTAKIGAVGLLSVAGAYWRGKSDNPMLTRIYGTAFAYQEGARGVSRAPGDGAPARPPQAGPGTGPVQLPRRGPGLPVLPSQGHAGHQRPARLLAPGARPGRLRGDQDAHHARAHPLGALRPLGQLQGQHVLHRRSTRSISP